ncbi:hypothetical protein EON68_03000, partial [archaeon]
MHNGSSLVCATTAWLLRPPAATARWRAVARMTRGGGTVKNVRPRTRVRACECARAAAHALRCERRHAYARTHARCMTMAVPTSVAQRFVGLTRAFINNSLYALPGGYFTSRDIIASPGALVNFGSLLGKLEYQATLARLYDRSAEGWLTPVEIFAPHYSNAIAAYCAATALATSAAATRQPFIVYEIGGGYGTNAKYFCQAVKEHYPALYSVMSYTILEISPALAARQTAALAEHAAVARSTVMDATQLSSGHMFDARPCFVIGCEVLDNLPHDKLVFTDAASPAPRDASSDADACVAATRAGANTRAREAVQAETLPEMDLSRWRETWVVEQAAAAEAAEAAEAGAPQSPPPPQRVFAEELRPLQDSACIDTLSVMLAHAGMLGRSVLPAPPSARSWWRRLLPSTRNAHAQPAMFIPTGAYQLLAGLQAS